MAQAALDRLDWSYIGLAIGWTLSLVVGIMYLHMHREMPCLRIRRPPVLFIGILSLHVYGIMCIIGYVLAPVAPCIAEFWVMSIYLPFGIAMFHVANSQFLHVASRQKQYARMSPMSDRPSMQQEHAERLANRRWKRTVRGVERADNIERMMLCIAVELVAQLILTLFVFFGSKKFHPTYGIFDYTVKGTATGIRMKCGKGWNGGFPLYGNSSGLGSTRRTCCGNLEASATCTAGVSKPSAAAWLVFRLPLFGLQTFYIPQIASVNAYFVPPNWFAVSIFAMELITIALPIAQVFKTQTLRQETLDAIASWEKRQQLSATSVSSNAESEYTRSLKGGADSSTTLKAKETTQRTKSSFDSQKSDMFTMAALENALRMDANPLLQFAALKDFSGENVSFLIHVMEWRKLWLLLATSTSQHPRNQFIAAVRIYAQFISLEFSEFPINISSREMEHLHHILESAAAVLIRKQSTSSADSVTPFENLPPDSASTTDLKSGISLRHAWAREPAVGLAFDELGRVESLAGMAIPEAFAETIFGPAEREIKYLVLTNTWSKFVHASWEVDDKEMVAKEPQAKWWTGNVLCSV